MVAIVALRLDRALVGIEKAIVLLLLVALTGTVLMQVIGRHVLAVPNPWTEEIARYLFVWLSMIGAAVGVQTRSHFRLDLFLHRLPPIGKAIAEWAARIVVLLSAGTFAVQGMRYVEISSFSIAPATEIPMSWISSAIPVGMTLIVIHIVLGALGGSQEGHH